MRMNVLYNEEKIGNFNYKKFSPEDRIRLRELRMELRALWLPEREKEIKAWRQKVGINSKGELINFANLSRKQKQVFFQQANQFIYRIKSEAEKKLYSTLKSFGESRADCCKILGIEENKNLSEIKKKYRKLVLIHHPDHGGNSEFSLK